VTQAPRISIASVVHDGRVAEQYLLRSLEALEEPVQRLVLSNADNALTKNLASLYNVLLRLEGPTRRAFVHPDVTFGPDLVTRLSSAMDDMEAAGSPWGAIGIVGRAWEGEYVWGHETDAPQPVCTLDSCFLLTRTDLGLEFDAEHFDQFHCFVEDYCLQCHATGRGVWVVPVAAWHASATYNELGSRWGGYDRYRKQLDKKWRRRFPNLTTV
jgi:hypothetical protein